MRRWKLMLFLVLIGWSVYIFETGCAGTGKQELWEECALEIHQDCWEEWEEDVLDCGYQHYRKCIDDASSYLGSEFVYPNGS